MTDSPNLKTVAPQYFRIKGHVPRMGMPDQFGTEIKKLGLGLHVIKPKIGKVYTLTQ